MSFHHSPVSHYTLVMRAEMQIHIVFACSTRRKCALKQLAAVVIVIFFFEIRKRNARFAPPTGSCSRNEVEWCEASVSAVPAFVLAGDVALKDQ